MTEKRTSVFENGLIWFGAGVSIAEILTGTYLADLGFGKGLLAIIVGHIIGCTMLFLSGLIGGKVKKRHGNGKDELWKQGWTALFRTECDSAGGLDGYYDL